MQCHGQDPAETVPLNVKKLTRLARWGLGTRILSVVLSFHEPSGHSHREKRLQNTEKVQHEK